MTLLTRVGSTSNVPQKEYVIDTASDLTSLPQEFGTLALCIAEGAIYACNSDGTYVKMAP